MTVFSVGVAVQARKEVFLDAENPRAGAAERNLHTNHLIDAVDELVRALAYRRRVISVP